MDRVSFTPRSAQRIARVVRAVENARPAGVALEFRAQFISANKTVFRLATFTGAWSIGSAKTVTFKNRTSTPNTVSATNLFFPITSTAAGNRDCAVAKDGTAWYLIDAKMATASAIFVTSTVAGTSITEVQSRTFVSATTSQSVVTDIAISASFNTSNCTITIGKTASTASISVASGVSTGMFVTGTATAVFVFGTATASYLTLD
jgi:hypothetical protein